MLSKKALYIVSFLCFSNIILSQNLILNPSFENHVKCPDSIGQFDVLVKHWHRPNLGSTDYFNLCSKSVGKENFFGEQLPRSGQGFAGMYLYAPKDYREYIEGELANKLNAEDLYTITFYLSLSEQSSHSIKDLGVLFLDEKLAISRSDKFIDINQALNEINQSYLVAIRSKEFYRGEEIWEKVTFEYKAKGFEKFFVIGNFDKNITISKRKVRARTLENTAYFYIDDISLELASNVNKPSDNKKKELNDASLKPLVNQVYTLQNVLFEFDQHNLLETSKKELDGLYNYLSKAKNLHIEIYGHTDHVGTNARNEELSLLRAKEVALYLISKGLEPERITASGYGNRFPIASNSNEEGRTKNRRVEFKLVKP